MYIYLPNKNLMGQTHTHNHMPSLAILQKTHSTPHTSLTLTHTPSSAPSLITNTLLVYSYTSGLGLLSTDDRDADCTVRHPGVECPLSSCINVNAIIIYYFRAFRIQRLILHAVIYTSVPRVLAAVFHLTLLLVRVKELM